MVAEQFAGYLAELLEVELNEEIRLQARITIETGYGIVEMSLEDTSLSPEATLRQLLGRPNLASRERLDVFSLGPLVTLGLDKTHPLAVPQAATPLTANGAEVDENLLAVVLGDKTEAF